MDEALRLLHMPLGITGSGRVRYGAAMELFQRGVLSEAQLDAYRDASPHDGRDPAKLLLERRLPPPPPPAATPAAAVETLFHAARDYLATLHHPGAAEVDAGLGRCVPSPRLPQARPHPIAERWLAPALAEVARWRPLLSKSIATAAPHLSWVSYDAYPRADIGSSFADGHVFASIAGSDAAFTAKDFELGLFLIAPQVLYRDQCHRAPELYAPLTGPHGWRFGLKRPLIVKPAGEPVWNPSLQSHLIKVGSSPFFCLFVWTRDVSEGAKVIPADDWDQVEAIELTRSQGAS
jgi:hypothetical protein